MTGIPPHHVRNELPRTLFHILGGVGLGGVGFFLPFPWNLLALAGSLAVVLLWETRRLQDPAFNNAANQALEVVLRPYERRGWTGAPPFVAGVLLAFLLFSREVAVLAVAALVIGDRAAVLVGKSLGRIRIGTMRKTVEGSAACFLSSLLIFVVLERVLPGLPPFTLPTLAWAALVGTLAELLPPPFNDNLAMPVAVGLYLTPFADILSRFPGF